MHSQTHHMPAPRARTTCPQGEPAGGGRRQCSFWERRVLPSVKYFNDLTVTHTDEEYMRKHNEVDGRAIYFISANEQQPEILEMGFELTAYQPTLQAHREQGKPRIYQTIYLDQQRSSLWTIGELKPESIIDRAWWSAFSHTYKHFRHVVPWVWTMQGHKHTWFAGSWTLFNTHDIAISSGLAVAHRLGAPYPFEHNALATATFDTVYAANHLRMRSWFVNREALEEHPHPTTLNPRPTTLNPHPTTLNPHPITLSPYYPHLITLTVSPSTRNPHPHPSPSPSLLTSHLSPYHPHPNTLSLSPSPYHPHPQVRLLRSPQGDAVLRVARLKPSQAKPSQAQPSPAKPSQAQTTRRFRGGRGR